MKHMVPNTAAGPQLVIQIPRLPAPVSVTVLCSLAVRKMRLTRLKRRRTMLLQSCEELGLGGLPRRMFGEDSFKQVLDLDGW
jgi:hypothetical protein